MSGSDATRGAAETRGPLKILQRIEREAEDLLVLTRWLERHKSTEFGNLLGPIRRIVRIAAAGLESLEESS